MSRTERVGTGPTDETFESVYDALETERRRTEAERRAFDAFADRVADVQPSGARRGSDPDRGGTAAASAIAAPELTFVSAPSAAASPLEAVRTAYEETVMSLPFYEEEYGDTYDESLREEFGPDVAAALTQRSAFSPTVKRVLLAKAEEARSERELLLESCERERKSIEDAADALLPVAEGLRSLEAIGFDAAEPSALDAYGARLSALRDTCERVAAARQATIREHRATYGRATDTLDLCEYLYQPLPSTFPVLNACGALTRRIEDCGGQLELAFDPERPA